MEYSIKYSVLVSLVGARADVTDQDPLITHLAWDSRNAKPNGAFFCIVGAFSDGHDYALAAYNKGCRVFICERRPAGLPNDALIIIARDGSRRALADAAAEFYRHPERDITLVGITGTKGKTTTAFFVHSVLNRIGIPSGYVGTNGVNYLDKHYDTANTTPESCELLRYLAEMRDSGVRVAVVEASSQALKMDRLRGISFDICVFTNLSPDHIGAHEHPDLADYKNCKLRLFSEHCRGDVIVNSDSEEAEAVIAAAPRARVLRCSCEGRAADFLASDIRPAELGESFAASFLCTDATGSRRVCTELPGVFNVSNALLAYAVCTVIADERFGKSDRSAIAEAIGSVKVQGRLEVHRLGEVDFVIDYAHNGASLRAVLGALRERRPRRLICLFGSIGGRSQSRREQLALAAAELADVSIVTSDNPDCENPGKIIEGIIRHFPAGYPYFTFTDRAEAIRFAVNYAEPGDTVLFAGKGHENYQLINGEKYPFNELKILTDAFEHGAKVGEKAGSEA